MADADLRTDALLVAALCRGEMAAFDVLYARHKEYVAALALRFAGNPEELRWTCCRRRLRTWRGRRRGGIFVLTVQMTTFLYPVVKNTAIAIRKKRRREPNVAEETVAGVAAADPPVEAGAARGELAALLAGLAESHREVLLLRFVDDFSLEEIGRALAIPLGTVKSRLHNAIAALREDPRTARYSPP